MAMQGLRRGVMRYAEGEADVPVQQPSGLSQDTAAFNPSGGIPGAIGRGLASVLQQRTTTPASEFINPAAGVLENISRNMRAQSVAAAPVPSSIERMGALIFDRSGALHADHMARDQAGQTLGHSDVQQYLVNNPDELRRAEADPVGFAHYIQTAGQNHQAAQGGTIEHPTPMAGDGTKIVKTIANPSTTAAMATQLGVTVPQAHVAAEPQAYSHKELTDVLAHMPLRVVHTLFGAQLGHVSVQDSIARSLIGSMQKDLAEAQAEYEKDPKNADKKKARDTLKNNLYGVMGSMAHGYSPLPFTGQQ